MGPAAIVRHLLSPCELNFCTLGLIHSEKLEKLENLLDMVKNQVGKILLRIKTFSDDLIFVRMLVECCFLWTILLRFRVSSLKGQPY